MVAADGDEPGAGDLRRQLGRGAHEAIVGADEHERGHGDTRRVGVAHPRPDDGSQRQAIGAGGLGKGAELAARGVGDLCRVVGEQPIEHGPAVGGAADAATLAFVVGGRVDVALLVLANLPALLLGGLLVRLVRREGGDAPAAERAAWFVALVPPAFVLVFGYSEAIAGCLAVATFLALRSKRWWWAAAAGFLSGLTRPSGALLAVPALVEAARGLRGASPRDVAGRLSAVVAPVAGVGAYLVWVGVRFGTPMLPVQIQQRSWLRGGFVNPVLALFRAGRDAFGGHFGGNGFHFPLMVVAVLLVVVVCLRWPAAYGAYAVVTVLVAFSAERLGSVERYCFLAFPLVLAIVSLTRSRRVELGALVASSVCMAALATLALLGAYVP